MCIILSITNRKITNQHIYLYYYSFSFFLKIWINKTNRYTCVFAEVISLEENWGDHLMSIYKPDMAVSHYIEAGKMSVALKAAIDAQQWQRAADIIDVVGEDNVPAEHYSLLGRYYASVKMYDPAEKFFTLAKLPLEVIKMHIITGHFHLIIFLFVPFIKLLYSHIYSIEVKVSMDR